MPERTTVRLSPKVMSLAKRKAAEEGTTLTALIEDALLRRIDETRKSSKATRILPRISKATGGFQPGMDLSKVQEIEDDEYAQRLKRGFT